MVLIGPGKTYCLGEGGNSEFGGDEGGTAPAAIGLPFNRPARQRASDATGCGSSARAFSRSVPSNRVGRAPFHSRRPDERVLPRPSPRPRFPGDRSVLAALIAAKIVPDFVQRGR